jgi:hypothetical protein
MAPMRSVLAVSAGVATIVLLIGAQDLESYDHAFFSLDRGTAAAPIRLFGQPVYTLALGLGVRLPLHGCLGASPAAAVAPYLPAPLTYWLLLAVAIAAAATVVHHAITPLCGRLGTTAALVLLFWSVPMANHTIFADWPETAVTYSAFIAAVFAPHAVLALSGSRSSARLPAIFVAGIVWGLVSGAHPGYWPLLAVSTVLSSLLALLRSEYPLRLRVAAAGVLSVAACLAVALQAPDLLREIAAAREGGREARRLVDGAAGGLVAANLFPFWQTGSRAPFTFLVLALVSVVIGLTSDPDRRGLIVGSALVSVLLGVAAATIVPGAFVFAPSNTWTLRDPAVAFAILSAAAAAGAVRRLGAAHAGACRAAVAALAVAGLQGPASAAHLVVADLRQAADRSPWTHDFRTPAARVAARGLSPDRLPPGRLAFWPGVGDMMRNARRPSADFADAGYSLTTAWTKQRTMSGMVEPNPLLFNQVTDLPPAILCDTNAVQFLQLRYLLMPDDVSCTAWSRAAAVTVDGELVVGVPHARDDLVRAAAESTLSSELRRAPALSSRSTLLATLVPLEDTTLQLGPRGIEITLADVPAVRSHVLVLPVAHDPAWRASSGRVENIGGLLALADVSRSPVRLDFVPDTVATLRALAMTAGQSLTMLGLVGLAVLRSAVVR